MSTVTGLAPLPDSPEELAQFYGDPPNGVRANMVMTVDGAGAFDGRTKAISSDADQTLLAYLRRHADAVMVGAATVQAEKYGSVRLDQEVQAERVDAGYEPLPPLVIVTAHAALPTSLKVFNGEGPRPIIATLQATAEAATELRDVADIVVVGGDEIEPGRILSVLEERGLHRVLCEGGPYLLTTLIEADLVDDMCLTLSPFLAGAQPTAPRPKSTREAPERLTLRHVLTHDDLLYLRYSRDA
jgi:riboflavin-specific deaminase-like protein